MVAAKSNGANADRVDLPITALSILVGSGFDCFVWSGLRACAEIGPPSLSEDRLEPSVEEGRSRFAALGETRSKAATWPMTSRVPLSGKS